MLVPVLVDRQRCDAATTEAVKNMMLMNPPSALSVLVPLWALRVQHWQTSCSSYEQMSGLRPPAAGLLLI